MLFTILRKGLGNVDDDDDDVEDPPQKKTQRMECILFLPMSYFSCITICFDEIITLQPKINEKKI